jgi:predicted DNA-binding transcriptional regulator AlpA
MRRVTPRIYTIELRRISEALIADGCVTLDEQAKALGLGRSTVWNIIRNKHKLGRLSAKTINRILTNSETPPTVRAIVERYKSERSVAAHSKAQTKPQRLPLS